MSRTVIVQGGNLFEVAVTYLGDARAAWLIAQANGLEDFWLVGPTTLVIPMVGPGDMNDGVPAAG